MGNWKTPQELKYAKTDEWILVEGDTATIGISDYAQDALNDIVYIEFRSVGDVIEAGAPFGEVESVKASSELNAPVKGEIIEVNTSLEDNPETINSDPYGKGWMVKIKILDASGLDGLMSAEDYAVYCENR